MTNVTLLDVGHGNCAVVRGDAATVVVDCPTGALLLDTLEDMGVKAVNMAIISHADKDHIAGILALLTSNRIQVERVYVNPDGQKSTKIWEAFRYAVAEAARKGNVHVVTSLTSSMPGRIDLGDASITVVSPSPALALAGIGGRSLEGRPISSNTMSGVLRIEADDASEGLLLAGDMDEISLDDALQAGENLKAKVLVFPHHGGLPGNGDSAGFAARLLDAVQPQFVVFSNGRGRHDNPRPEIIGPARDRGCAIACTQLSERCHPKAVEDDRYLEPIRAQGRNGGACCAGSITFVLDPAAKRIPDAAKRHGDFVSGRVSRPMCRTK